MWVGFQVVQAGRESALDRIEIGEDVIGEAVFSNRLPQVLSRVQLGTVGRQEDQPHVVRYDQLTGQMPAGLVHDHEDEFVGVALCDLGQDSDIVSALTQGRTRLSITLSCGLTALKA